MYIIWLLRQKLSRLLFNDWRIHIEYKNGSGMFLNFDPEKQRIILDTNKPIKVLNK